MIIKRNSKGQFIKGNVPFDRTGIKHTDKTKKKLKKARVGKKPNLGHHHSEEFKERQRETVKKQWELGTRNNDKLKGRKLTKEFKERLSVLRIGSKNPAYIDGRKKITHRIRHSSKYRQWRTDIFIRDNYTCVLCNLKNGNGKKIYLEADHYPKSFSQIFSEYSIKTYKEAMECKEFWDLKNGRTVCLDCHKKHHHNERIKQYNL